MISLFDMFKVGIGPSSSHTVGPMKAGKQFVDDLVEKGLLNAVTRVAVDVYGSLSLTGKGHHTDIAIIMGLAGNQPDTVDIDAIPAFIRDVETRGRLLLANGQHEVDFPADDGMRFRSDNLPLHENGMTIHAWAGEKEIYCKTYYSIGGGFIVDEEHFGKENANELQVPYPFKSAQEMLAYCKETGLSLSGMVMQNELALHSKKEIEDYFANVWQTMRACIDRGMNTEGVLPGPLRVPRRASALRRNRADQRRLRHRSGGTRLLRSLYRIRQPGDLYPLLYGLRCDRRAVQDECLHFRRRSRLSGRSGRRLLDGGGGSGRTARRQPGTGLRGGGDWHGTQPRTDLRPGRRPGTGAVH